MIGTANQVEWAERIKALANDEFDRVAKAFQAVAGRQAGQDRSETGVILAILEEKRAEVMANDRAGYFICNWQELSDQVRQMIVQDARYRDILANRSARRSRL
ncbi:MAG: hypothetical protein ABUS49_09610 [Acidobacteriota bacterium]